MKPTLASCRFSDSRKTVYRLNDSDTTIQPADAADKVDHRSEQLPSKRETKSKRGKKSKQN